ncbi:MAG: rhomboid family intramembrane serine protease [Deferribacteres bacterium]|nr:rhomboid family intramembrane serine protease [candidate division KSB1 bacterium]MCB9501510.1 rhomboid family intramembrane serine protease [Deferribacteres bacterium]
MIPFRDDNPRLEFPFITTILLAANISVHVFRWFMPETDSTNIILAFGAIPDRILAGEGIFTLFTSMYLHGDIVHLIGNMLYLWVFGDNVENIMGPIKFIIFYHLCGLGATMMHVFIEPASHIPMIGASGAISGVLGAYLLQFPRARVSVVVPVLIFLHTMRIPAFFVLGIWFVFQILSGLGALENGARDGIAWFAHIGGFVIGMLLLRFFQDPKRVLTYRYHNSYFD